MKNKILRDMGKQKKEGDICVYLSGAITGHAEEARSYFLAVEQYAKSILPNSKVFNPTNLPEMGIWENYMKICRSLVENWATYVFVIENEYTASSKGVAEELMIAKKFGKAICYLKVDPETYEIGRPRWQS